MAERHIENTDTEANVARHEKHTEPNWRDLTWQDLESWTGSGSLKRGRDYKSHVHDLAISASGELLAWVQGTHRYATCVRLQGKTPIGRCTCPVGSSGCKHAVAVVLAYLDALKKDGTVSTARDSDSRWKKIEEGPMAGEDFYGDGYDEDDEDYDEDEEGHDEDDEEMEEEEVEELATSPRGPVASGDSGWLAYLNGLSQSELLSLLSDAARQHPELRRQLEQRAALASGKSGELLREARKIVRPGRGEWRTPNYPHLKGLLERLVGMGQIDSVLDLGRELVVSGSEHLETEEEGESTEDIVECLDVVFPAILASSRPDPEKILYVIDLCDLDEYDLTQNADTVLDREWSRETWSAVADEMARRLEALPAPGKDFISGYRRKGVSSWLRQCLENAGRQDEVLPLLEREAPLTNSYDQLVDALLEAGRTEDARRWIVEGIEKTQHSASGLADQLRVRWRQLAEKEDDWASVAARRAEEFFHNPHVGSLRDLLKAADKADCRPAVESAAMHFLETGERPQPADKPKGRAKKADTGWPLPAVPEFMKEVRPSHGARKEGPHFDVLLALALEAKNPDEVLRWFDQMPKERMARGYYFNDNRSTVADAIANTHPDRAAALYREIAEGFVAQTSPSAYESALPYFRKLKSLWEKNGQGAEWVKYEARLREQHHRKKRFLEVLNRVPTRRVIDT